MHHSRPWRAAFLWMLGLSLFFFLSYGFANWATSQRSYVPSIVFGWEHHIPFLAWTIVPYWSTDLLYALSLFLCRTRRELDSHAESLLTAQIISVSVFLVFPLRFTFAHPQPEGAFGFMFHVLGSFDKPFNQAPSLHISLIAILWTKYSEHTRGLLRFLLRSWLLLCGLSTLTTYQHHFIDLLTGLWVGLFCTVLFSDRQTAVKPKPLRPLSIVALGSAYFAGSLCLIIAACRFAGIGWLLLWPAGALLMVAVVYWTWSPRLFRNHDGAMSFASVVLLAPYLLGAWLNSRWWTRGEPPAQEIVSGIWLGRAPTRKERDLLGIASVVHLAPELPINTNGIVCRGVPMLDLVAPDPSDLEAAVKAIEALKPVRPTLVCCALGYSRSAAAIAAWLVASQTVPSVDAAIALLRTHRRSMVVRDAHRARLEEWACARRIYGNGVQWGECVAVS